MLYRQKGFPEIDEVVLCKVTKIYPNSVFVDLIEYEKSGIIHISEVSPGRIRNLRDFVSVGRQIVCKILRIDREKGHIDLSLRRVNSSQRREKIDDIKQEQKAESLVKNVGKKLDKPLHALYDQISNPIFNDYSYLYLCFKDVAAGECDLQKMGIPKDIAESLTQAIIDKFKPKKITIQGEITLQTYSPEGVEKIKDVLIKIEKVSDTLKLFYLGAGRFKVVVEDFEYKPAEDNLKKVEKILEKFNDKLSKSSFEREKNE